MFATLHHIVTVAIETVRTGGRILNNRLVPMTGIELLMRLDIVGHDGLGQSDLADLGPEGVATAQRWLLALAAGGLVEMALEDRYCLTRQGHEALSLLAA
jgi:hypothetical protein